MGEIDAALRKPDCPYMVPSKMCLDPLNIQRQLELLRTFQLALSKFSLKKN